MRISLLWLKDYVDLPESPAEVGDILTRLGLVVDGMEGKGDRTVYELDVTTNRPDCLSHIGVARELACATGRILSLPDLSYTESEPAVEDTASVKVEAPDLCPRYTARGVKGVTIAEAPDWMKERLELAGLRPINNVVDCTNFVLLEYGQPLHAFDLELVTGNTIIVRRAKEGEPMVLLDGATHKMSADTLVIADPREPIALAGVMGGANTEINSQTKDVLLESALFQNTSVRRTARALGVSTESSYRFERGVDPVGVDLASRRAVKLIIETGGGTAMEGVIDSNPAAFSPLEISLPMEEVERVLGMGVTVNEAESILIALGLQVVTSSPTTLTVTPPSWRPDLSRPIDLIEEIARIKGYGSIPSEVGLRVMPVRKTPADRLNELTGATFLSAGFEEVITDSFISEAEKGFFSTGKGLRVTNPVRKGQDLLRCSLVPSLLQVLSRARRNEVEEARVFESGIVYLPLEEGALPEERRMLAAADLSGVESIKGAVEALSDYLSQGALEWKEEESTGFSNDAALALYVNGERHGVLGIIDEKAAALYELPDGAAAFECRISALEDAFEEPHFSPLRRFPSVERDVALVVPEDTSWLQVERAIRRHAPPEQEGFRFVETYRGGQIGPGKKSFLIQMTYRHPERTLTDEEVNSLHQAFVEALLEQTGGSIRA